MDPVRQVVQNGIFEDLRDHRIYFGLCWGKQNWFLGVKTAGLRMAQGFRLLFFVSCVVRLKEGAGPMPGVGSWQGIQELHTPRDPYPLCN